MAAGQHLTQEQISAWVLGERSSEAAHHMRNCSACHAEVLLLGTTLLDFRSAVREWSREQATSAVIPPPVSIHRSVFAFSRTWLALAAAVGCALVGVSLRPHSPQPPSAISDRVLMNQVDDEISRTVPTAMEPLLQLVAWQGDSSEPSGSALNKERNEGAAN